MPRGNVEVSAIASRSHSGAASKVSQFQTSAKAIPEEHTDKGRQEYERCGRHERERIEAIIKVEECNRRMRSITGFAHPNADESDPGEVEQSDDRPDRQRLLSKDRCGA